MVEFPQLLVPPLRKSKRHTVNVFGEKSTSVSFTSRVRLGKWCNFKHQSCEFQECRYWWHQNLIICWSPNSVTWDHCTPYPEPALTTWEIKIPLEPLVKRKGQLQLKIAVSLLNHTFNIGSNSNRAVQAPESNTDLKMQWWGIGKQQVFTCL